MALRHSNRHPYLPLFRQKTTNPITRTTLAIAFLIPLIAIVIIQPHNFIDTLRPHIAPPLDFDFPPPLSHHFAHIQRPPVSPLPPPPDWRRPSVLTAHAHPHPNHGYFLTIYTTGTDAGWFERDLKRLGCAIGNTFYPVHRAYSETVRCRIPELPPDGAPITALLAWDDAMQSAIDNPHWIYGVSFPILQGDVKPSNETLNDERVALVRSNLRWYPQMFDAPRPNQPLYELCIMTEIKHDTHLLPDWISFYRRLGVDKFYIYDNRAPTALDHIDRYYTEVVYWPWTRAQAQAYNHFLFSSKTRCKYSAFFDVDEYAFIGTDRPRLLPAYVANRIKQGYHQAVLPQLQMNSNGHIKRPPGPVPERYTRVEEYQRGFGVKPILITDFQWHFHKINQALGGNTYFNISVIPDPKTLDDNAIIVHYVSRSWEEFVDKRREGSTAINMKYFPPSELNVSNPQDWYLTQAHSWEMFQFRTFWRRVMKLRDSGEVRMTWNERNQSCFQDYCPSCLFRSMGPVRCINP